ncbi:MAG: hypothetical protein ACREEX_12855, partial [Caulobacteraceae bacterium]
SIGAGDVDRVAMSTTRGGTAASASSDSGLARDISSGSSLNVPVFARSVATANETLRCRRGPFALASEAQIV